MYDSTRNMNKNYTDDISAYKKDIKSSGLDKLLTPEREKELATTIQTSKSKKLRKNALDELVGHNLRLVINVASKCLVQVRYSPTLSFGDLISAGNIGLVNAAKIFSPDYGRFSSYAYFAIRNAIWGYINDTISTVRTPRHHKDVLCKMWKLQQELGGEIDNDFISKEIGVTKERLELVIDTSWKCNATSLDIPITFGDDISEIRTRVDTLEDNRNLDNLLNAMEQEDWYQYISEKMKVLNYNEQIALFLHYFAYEHFRLEDIGELIGYTKERVRQFLFAAIKKLKKAIAIDHVGDVSGVSMVTHGQYGTDKTQGQVEHLFLSYIDLRNISDIIKQEIIGDNSVTSEEYAFLAEKFDMKKFGWRINKIIEKDIRLAAFLPKDVYKIIASKVLEDFHLSQYDYSFIEKNAHKGYIWLSQEMLCSDKQLYDYYQERYSHIELSNRPF